MAPTLGQMIAAIGSPAEWGAIAVADLMWDNTAKSLMVAGDIKTVGWTDYSSTVTFTGIDDWTGGWKQIFYKKIGKLVFLTWSFGGHKNTPGTAQLRITIPYAANGVCYGCCPVADNNIWLATSGAWKIDTSTLYFGKTTALTYDDFDATADSVRAAIGTAIYEATT